MGNQPTKGHGRDRIPAHWKSRLRQERFMTLMRALFIIFGLLALYFVVFLAASVEGDPQPDVKFEDFSGGINTKDNPFSIPFNEYLQLHEYILDGEYGSAVLRKGDVNRIDSLATSLGSDTVWSCAIVDTFNAVAWEPNQFIYYTVTCDNPVPIQDGLLEGIDADSLDRTAGASPPPAWTGKDFTIVNNFQWNNEVTTRMVLVADTLDSELGIGDSLQVTMTTAQWSGALDTGGITGVYSLYTKPVNKQLLYIVPGFGNLDRWSSLYASESYQYSPNNFLADYIYRGETPLWATWRGWAYIALPRQRPMITNGAKATMMIPRAPGQVEILPVASESDTAASDTAWTIDGTPRYVIVNRLADITGDATENSLGLCKQLGYISHPIPLFDELALLYSFPRQAHDSIAASYITSDSVLLYILRTRGHASRPHPEFDTLFIVDSLISDSPTFFLDTATFLDSIPNESLGTSNWIAATDSAGFVLLLPVDTGRFNTQTDIRDTTSPDRNPQWTAPGAPTFINQYQGDTTNDFWPRNAKTDSSNRFHIGWQYGLSQYDSTIENAQMSAMSPLLTVSTSSPLGLGGIDSTIAFDIGIPKSTAHDKDLVKVLWRRQIKYEPNLDSFVVVDDTVMITGGFGAFAITADREFNPGVGDFIRKTNLYLDSNITFSAFFPVGVIIGNTDSIFEDSVSWGDLMSGGRTQAGVDFDRRFNPINTNIAIVKGFFPFKSHLFAYTDQSFYRSNVDTATYELFSAVSFDPGTGDVITGIANIGPNLVVFWSNGLTELYDPSGAIPTKGAPMTGVGLIAPQSLINYGGTIYFMARDGIRALSAHQVKNYGVTNPLISRKINDQIVDGKSDSLKSTMVSAIGTGGKTIVFCYPSISKMYVYYPELDSWTTRSGSFFQATHYDTSRIEGLQLSSTMLYARSGDQRVFDFQTSALLFDSGTTNAAYTGIIETRPFKNEDINVYEVDKVGKLAGNTNTRTGTFTVKNDSGTTEVTESFPATDPMYSVHGIKYNESNFFTLQWATGLATTADTVRAFHIWTKYIHGPRIR